MRTASVEEYALIVGYRCLCGWDCRSVELDGLDIQGRILQLVCKGAVCLLLVWLDIRGETAVLKGVDAYLVRLKYERAKVVLS